MHNYFWRGVIYAALGFFALSVGDGVTKWFAPIYAAPNYAFWAYTGALPVLLFAALQRRDLPALWRSRAPRLQALRGFMIACEFVAIVYALSQAPIASVYTILFCAPIASTLLAGPVLGEWPDKLSWSAILVGFIGVLIVLRPGLAVIEPGLIAALCAAFVFGISALIARKIGDESILPFAFYPIVTTLALLLPALVALDDLVMPAWQDLPFIWITGITSAGGMMLIARAFIYAPVPVAAAFYYSLLIWGSLIGYFVFNETPGWPTYIGSAVIIASGMFITWHGHKQDKQTATRANL
jgi:drug/metabolite transporter (DMT)-like permease